MGTVITNDALGTEVIKRFESLKAARSTWNNHWDEVAKFVIPRKDNVYGQLVPGEKQTNRLFDIEAIQAADDLAAALHGLLTNPSIMWFLLSTGNKEVDSDKDVQKWLFDSALSMHQKLNASNFQTEISETYLDLGSIGTTSLRMEEDEDDVFRFYSEPIYDVVVSENAKGIIDLVSRTYEFTARQIIDKFGEDALDEVTRAEAMQNPSKKFKIVHEVAPRSEVDRGKGVGAKAMAFRSIHVLKSGAKVLDESGFEEWPYATPRWSKINAETYGRSPAMKALAEIKMVNSMKKVTIQGAQLRIAPPMQVPDNGFMGPLQVKPFGTNYYRANSKNRIEPLFTAADPGLGKDLIDDEHLMIKRAFLLDKLITPQLDRMTATEVIQRRDEQLRFLGPTLGRLDRELLKPIVDRAFGIMNRRKMFKEIPAKLLEFVQSQGGKFDLLIKYKSTVAQAQLISQADNMVRAIQATSIVVPAMPEIMDNIDGDKLLKKNFEIYGVDPEILRSDKEVEKIRQSRQAAAQQAAENSQAESEAEVINKVGETDAKLNGGQG